MPQLKTIDVKACTVEEAVKIALEKLGVPKKKVTIKVLTEEEKGLFGMKGAKPAKVRVTVKEE